MSKLPSKLGHEIEVAIASRFVRYADSVQYLASFRSKTGVVFAIERVTQAHINLWTTVQPAIQAQAEAIGCIVELRTPWPTGRGPKAKYGRISSLKSVAPLAEAPLLKIQLRSVDDAMQVLSRLQ